MPPLELRLGADTLSFASPRDFELELSRRTSVAASRASALLARPIAALLKEARDIQELSARLSSVLTRSGEDPEALHEFLVAIRATAFSKEHQWRDIILSLKRLPATYDAYKFLALAKYFQYLSERRDVLSNAYRAQPGVAAPEGSGEYRGGTARLADTLVSEPVRLESLVRKTERYERLPCGETFEFEIGEGTSFPLQLSRRPFRLIAGEPFQLWYHDAHWQLASGLNLVGRARTCDIKLDESFRDVSRRHLVIETVSGRRFRLTDLSSRGTYVLRQELSRAGVA